MTRRHHDSRKKKKRVRSNSHHNGPQEESSSYGGTTASSSSLEEDLRQQRIRQQERDVEQTKREEENVRKRDEERRLQLREHQRDLELQQIWRQPTTPQKLILKGMITSVKKDFTIVLPPSYTLCHVIQSSSLWQGHERRRLSHFFHSKWLLDNMGIDPRAFLLYSKKYKWTDRTLPDGSHSSWDLSCKDRLHPSSRTFDVANLNGGAGALPTIASIVEEGWSLFHGNKEEGVSVQRTIPVNAIRFHEKTSRVGIIRQTNNNNNNDMSREPLLLYDINPDHTKTLLFSLNLDGIPMNDISFGQDLMIMAGPCRYQGKPIRPLLLPLSPQGNPRDVRELNLQNLSESDILRVEMTCKNGAFIGFGHRNGQVSFLDLRQSTSVCSILHCEESSGSSTAVMPLGSATDLCFLSSLDTQKVLVRRSHGTCQLHDLRTASSNAISRLHLSSSPTLLWNLAVPLDDISPTLTARCNGFAMDPHDGQTMISPYISSSNHARLGMWSLQTGHMLGSRLLKDSSSGDDVMFVELCQKTTSSFVGEKDARATCRKSAFSVWAKCGAHSKKEVGSKVGSLHQISFSGSCD